jgi:hypothetical protein
VSDDMVSVLAVIVLVLWIGTLLWLGYVRRG